MDVATSHLILVSMIIRVLEESSEGIITKLSSWHVWDAKLLSLHLLKEWKEKWLEKVSIILELEENSELRGSKKEKTLLNLLSISIMEPLIFFYWYLVSESNER